MNESLVTHPKADAEENVSGTPLQVNKWRELGKLVLVLAMAAASFYQLMHLAMHVANLTASLAQDPTQNWRQFFPSSIQDVDKLSQLLTRLSASNFLPVFLLFVGIYVWKQAFAIPGSALLNLLAGVLYGPVAGCALVSLLTAAGSTLCFLLSKHLGGGFVVHFVIGRPRLAGLERSVRRHQKDSLFFYCLFIRLFPFTPNWLFNVASPWVGVPLHLFFASVLLGCIPYNFTCTQAGSILSSIHSMSDIMTANIVIRLALMACVALLPVFIRERYWKAMKDEEQAKLL